MQKKEHSILWVDLVAYAKEFVADCDLEAKLSQFLDEEQIKRACDYAMTFKVYATCVKLYDEILYIYFDDSSCLGLFIKC